MTGAPTSILERYYSYKRTTKITLDWLRIQAKGSEDTSNAAFTTTKEIVQAAEKVRSSRTTVPKYVLSALRDTIRQRWKVFEAFASAKGARKDQEVKMRDERHRAFILRLEQALQILLALEAKESQTHPLQNSPQEDSNRYTVLPLVDELEKIAPTLGESNTDYNQLDAVTKEPDLSDITAEVPSVESTDDLLLKDDEFGEFVTLSFFINELDTLLFKVDTYWKAAASKQLPVIVAAWLSTTTLHAVERLFPKISHIAADYDTFVTRWIKQRSLWDVRLRFKDVPDLCSEPGRFWQIQALSLWGQLLQHCRTAKEYEKIVPTAGSRQYPEELIQNPAEASDSVAYHDDNAMDNMQESMRLGLRTKRGITGMEAGTSISEPLLPLLDKVLKDNNEPIPLHLVFGYEMLVSSFKAYLWQDGQLNRQNCRLIALSFAIQVQKSIRAAAKHDLDSYNCKGIDPNSQRARNFCLSSLADEALGNFTSEKKFDLYHQAPWTAGCHMVEILTFSMWEGLNLCLKSGHICSLLHLYNALRHIEPALPRSKIMDQLCEIFLDGIFAGALPTNNFPSHFRSALGGRLSKTIESKKRSTRLTLPEKPLDYGTIPKNLSLFYTLHNFNYATTQDLWQMVYFGRKHDHVTRKQTQEMLETIHSKPFNVPLDRIKEAVLPEFTGPIPVARLDYFSIYSFSVDLLSKLIASVDARDGIRGKGAPATIFVDLILEQIMVHLNDSSRRDMLQFWRPLANIKRVFAEVDSDLSVDEFAWSI